MDDRELLELAAKAAGYRVNKSSGLSDWLWVSTDKGRSWHEWNSLTDDGDALRLAVKLQIDLSFFGNEPSGIDAFPDGSFGRYAVTECNANDPYAATRRAIVRAAAEIGRSM